MNLYVDMDNTIMDSSRAICDMYNDRYYYNKDFVKAVPKENKIWSFSDICPLATEQEIIDMFSSEEFFNKVDIFDGVTEALKNIKNKFDVKLIIVTVGTLKNIMYKTEWLESYLENIIDGWHFTGGKEIIMDKSFLNDNLGVIVDDHNSNLTSANVGMRICATMYEGEWNQNCLFEKRDNWKDIEIEIDKYFSKIKYLRK